MNDPDKRKVIKNFLRRYKADMVCLQETKVQEMNSVMARSLGVGRWLNWKALEADGSAGLFFCFRIIAELVGGLYGRLFLYLVLV